VEYGGRGLAPALEFILNQELENAGVQRAKSPSHQGVNNLGPALIRHGTAEQKQRLLPGILGVRDRWCQGFSETEAGSDLAAVRTVARLDGDEFVVDGGKIWTSGAAGASWIYLLVRTGTREQRHRGLSFLVAPMTTPGITIAPIEQITGGSDFGEVTLEQVRVPRANLIGELGQGWAVTMTLLAAERLSGRHRHGLFRRELSALAGLLGESPVSEQGGTGGLRDLGRLVAEIEGMGALARRVESLHAAGADPGALPSVNKLWWPAAHQRLVEAGLLRATAAGVDPSYWYRQWLAARPESIYGGAAQIQRNIIAERFLGMPRP
jgi:alkylation response protein AidB-like acyl-CoA dehydrogenase